MSVVIHSTELVLSEEIHTFNLLSEFEAAMLREKVSFSFRYIRVEDLHRDFNYSAKISLAEHHQTLPVTYSSHNNTPQSTMMSLRSLSRAVPRSMPRIAARCQPRTLSTISPLRPTSLLQQTCKAVSTPRYAAFSTTQAAREKEGQGMAFKTSV